MSRFCRFLPFNSGAAGASAEIELIFATTGPIIGHVNMLLGLQDIDFKQPMMQSIPVNDRTDPWNMSGPVITTLVVSNDPVAYGYDETKSDTVQNLINDWSEELLVILKTSTGDDELRTFSFAQFGVGSTATLGKEIGMLTGSAFMLLTVILWFNFRSKRETAYVMTLTLFAVAATYGLSGWLQYAGVNMVFNAAMNSIPYVDTFLIGPYDLSASLNVLGDFSSSLMKDALNLFSDSCQSNNVSKGFHVVSPDSSSLKEVIDLGYTFIPIATDALLLDFGIQQLPRL